MENPITPFLPSRLSSLLPGASSYEITFSAPEDQTSIMLTLTLCSLQSKATYHWFLPELSETERQAICDYAECIIRLLSTIGATMSLTAPSNAVASRAAKSKRDKRAPSGGKDRIQKALSTGLFGPEGDDQ